jgi:hypothetical protein
MTLVGKRQSGDSSRHTGGLMAVAEAGFVYLALRVEIKNPG